MFTVNFILGIGFWYAFNLAEELIGKILPSPVNTVSIVTPDVISNEARRRIRLLQADTLELGKQVNAFGGHKHDKEFKVLEDTLTRQLIKLDSITSNDDIDIKRLRKRAVQQVMEIVDDLEKRSNEHAPSPPVTPAGHREYNYNQHAHKRTINHAEFSPGNSEGCSKVSAPAPPAPPTRLNADAKPFTPNNNVSSKPKRYINKLDRHSDELAPSLPVAPAKKDAYVVPSADLSKAERGELQQVIYKFKSISFDTRGLGRTSLLSCEIETEGRPIKQRYYNIARAKLKLLEAELDNMLKLGVVEPSNGSWSNPIVTVQKKDGTVRFCLDSRKLNKVTKKDSYPLPYINFIFDNLKGARYISSIDLSKAFWQIPLVN